MRQPEIKEKRKIPLFSAFGPDFLGLFVDDIGDVLTLAQIRGVFYGVVLATLFVVFAAVTFDLDQFVVDQILLALLDIAFDLGDGSSLGRFYSLLLGYWPHPLGRLNSNHGFALGAHDRVAFQIVKTGLAFLAFPLLTPA
jgi:hypothetical protein